MMIGAIFRVRQHVFVLSDPFVVGGRRLLWWSVKANGICPFCGVVGRREGKKGNTCLSQQQNVKYRLVRRERIEKNE